MEFKTFLSPNYVTVGKDIDTFQDLDGFSRVRGGNQSSGRRVNSHQNDSYYIAQKREGRWSRTQGIDLESQRGDLSCPLAS